MKLQKTFIFPDIISVFDPRSSSSAIGKILNVDKDQAKRYTKDRKAFKGRTSSQEF